MISENPLESRTMIWLMLISATQPTITIQSPINAGRSTHHQATVVVKVERGGINTPSYNSKQVKRWKTDIRRCCTHNRAECLTGYQSYQICQMVNNWGRVQLLPYGTCTIVGRTHKSHFHDLQIAVTFSRVVRLTGATAHWKVLEQKHSKVGFLFV